MASAHQPAGEIPLRDDCIVFRLAKVTHTFPANSKKPLSIHFELSGEEKHEGEESGRWALSVWDYARTTVDQAGTLLTTPGTRVPFGLQVGHVHEISIALDGHPLWVVRDVASSVIHAFEIGHCAILGLHRSQASDRKMLRDKLAQIAYPM